MRRQKRQFVMMVSLFVAAVAVYIVISGFGQPKEEEEGSYEVTELMAEEVTRLVFTNESGTVSLTKKNNIWNSDTDKTAKIDGKKVERLLTNITPLLSEECIKNVEDLSLYGLDQPARIIMISNGDQRYTIFAGDFDDVAKAYYVCLEEKPDWVYTIPYSAIGSFGVTLEELLSAHEPLSEITETDDKEIKQTVSEKATIR